MRVSVEFLAQAKVAAGVSGSELEVADAAAPRELLGRIVAAHPGVAALAGGSGGPSSMLLFVNDQQVDWDQDCALEAGDRILVTSPMSGG